MTAPVYLDAQYRYAGDDWTGDRAFVFTIFQTDASGNLTTTPQDISGSTPSGILGYRPQSRPENRSARPYIDPKLYNIGMQIMLTGTVTDGPNGVFELTLTSDQTVFPRQRIEDVQFAPSLLVLKARLTDASGKGTQGLVPVYVL